MRFFFFPLFFLFISCINEQTFVSPMSTCFNDRYSDSLQVYLPENEQLDNNNFNLFSCNTINGLEDVLEGSILVKQESNIIFKNRIWQGIPSIGKDNNNNLFVAWYSGGQTEGWNNYITVATSNNNGKNWHKNSLIIAPNDSVRFFDPSLFNDKFGNLYLCWAKTSSKTNNKFWTSTWSMKIHLLNDTIRFSTPKIIAEGILLNKPINLSDDKTILFPIAHWLSGDPSRQKPFIYKGIYGKNRLETFRNEGYIPLKNANRNYDEHMIVEVNPKHFLGMIRGNDGIYYSWSQDGINWVESKRLDELGVLASSRFYLGKLRTGNLIFIANNSSSKIRTNLTVFISTNGGKSWDNSRVIDNSLHISYPDIIEDSSTGRIFLVYDQERYSLGRIICSSFLESDILTPSGEITKIIIDKFK